MGNNKTIRLLIMVACFLYAGVQALKIWKGVYSWLEVFFLITFLSIGIVYLVLFLKQRNG